MLSFDRGSSSNSGTKEKRIYRVGPYTQQLQNEKADGNVVCAFGASSERRRQTRSAWATAIDVKTHTHTHTLSEREQW